MKNLDLWRWANICQQNRNWFLRTISCSGGVVTVYVSCFAKFEECQEISRFNKTQLFIQLKWKPWRIKKKIKTGIGKFEVTPDLFELISITVPDIKPLNFAWWKLQSGPRGWKISALHPEGIILTSLSGFLFLHCLHGNFISERFFLQKRWWMHCTCYLICNLFSQRLKSYVTFNQRMAKQICFWISHKFRWGQDRWLPDTLTSTTYFPRGTVTLLLL